MAKKKKSMEYSFKKYLSYIPEITYIKKISWSLQAQTSEKIENSQYFP